jgi:hypothetical protein
LDYLITPRYFALKILSVARFNTFHRCLNCTDNRESIMKKLIAIVVIGIALAPVGAFGQERTADAALGALSGAVVLGPLGAAVAVRSRTMPSD